MTTNNSEMSFFDHLRELRKRLIYIIIFSFIGAIVAFSYTSPILDLLRRPFVVAFEGYRLIGTGPGEGFSFRLWISFFAGIIITSPLIFHQIWLFVEPGLHDTERKLVIPFVFVSTILFCLGVWFGHEVMLPIAFTFFKEQYDVLGVAPEIRLTEYFGTVMKTVIGLGVVFEMPVFAFFLAKGGVLTAQSLLAGFRYAIVIIFIVAGVLSPPDVMSQFILAAPLLLLYGISILIVRIAQPKTD